MINKYQLGLIKELIRIGGTDTISVNVKDDLAILDYSPKTQLWNELEIICRGLIVNKTTLEIVARPFDKFFNWGERGASQPKGSIVSVAEKMDGSLGILYRYGENYAIATRHSFDSQQALWATQFFNTHWNKIKIPDSYTLLFEIIYPENRILLNYGNRQDLVLLAIRNRFNGEYLSNAEVDEFAKKYGFTRPAYFEVKNPDELLTYCEQLSGHEEGFVALMGNGDRWKFKGKRYLELHKKFKGISRKSVAKAIVDGTITNYLLEIPEEFCEEVETWHNGIWTFAENVEQDITKLFIQSPINSKKDFAIWVNKNVYPPYRRYMFAKYDGKLTLTDIIKTEYLS